MVSSNAFLVSLAFMFTYRLVRAIFISRSYNKVGQGGFKQQLKSKGYIQMSEVEPKSLIAATDAPAKGVEQEIRAGLHHRIDYLELARQLPARIISYNDLPRRPMLQRLGEKLNLDVREAWLASKLINQDDLEVVFSTSEKVGIPLNLLLNSKAKHLVQLAHPLSPKKLSLIKALAISRRWDIMLLPTHAEAEIFQARLKLSPDRLRVLPYAVDTQFYQPSEADQFQDNSQPDHILSLGVSHRDYPTLLKALSVLPQVFCQIRVGSMWVTSHLKFAKETLPDNVEILPYVHPHKLREIYSNARFVVVAIDGTTQWSAGCTSIVQAQSMGKAVIATRTPGMQDYVLDNETGILVELGNSRAMAEAIEYLWNNPDKAAEMGRRAQEWASHKFSLEYWLAEITALLKQLAAQA